MSYRQHFGLLAVCVAALSGCGENVGWVIKPVRIEEHLTETVIARDPGLFVPHKVAIVDISGLMMNERRFTFGEGSENPVSLFVEKLDKAQADPAVRAVIVRINSPGGGVTASDIMYRRLLRFRQEKKVPVIAMLEDVGASGAYYLACAAESILAHPTSVTGSIGVIVQTVSFAGTMKKLGIDARAVVSGPLKDLASPLKPLDEKDLAVLQGMVDRYYQGFLEAVVAGRPGLKPDQIKQLADGRVYTGEQAKANGLVDDVGYMHEAIALAKKRSRAERVRVVIYHRPFGYRANAYSAAEVPSPQVNLLNVSVPDLLSFTQPRFLYLWTGHMSGR